MYRLEYGYQLWNPQLKKDFLSLENIQKGFTQHVEKVSHLSYSDSLEPLLLLEERYLIIIYSYTYSILLSIEAFICSLYYNSFRHKSCKL